MTSSQAVRQPEVKVRLQQVREKLEKNPKMSYNNKPKANASSNSVAWDNFTQFDQFGKWV